MLLNIGTCLVQMASGDPKDGAAKRDDLCGDGEDLFAFINRAPIITRSAMEALQTFHEEDGGQAMLKAPYYQAPEKDTIAYHAPNRECILNIALVMCFRVVIQLCVSFTLYEKIIFPNSKIRDSTRWKSAEIWRAS